MYKASQNRYQNMEYRRCGDSGLKLPIVSLGLWHNFGDNAKLADMKAMLFSAFDAGITHFDIANNYGPKPGAAESNFGKIFKSDLKRYRDEMIVSTKAGYVMWDGPYGRGGSRKYLISSLDQSLKRTGLSYVDIFYHHCPDKDTPIEESMTALSDIVKSGKAQYVGISNYDGEGMIEAVKILNELKCPYIINQNRYNVLDRRIERNGLMKASKENKKGIICYSPLEQGILTDKYFNGVPNDSRIVTDGRFLKENDLDEVRLSKAKALNEIAKSRGQTLAQLALSWILSHQEITSVVIGASKPCQIEECAQIAGAKPLTQDQLNKTDEIAK
jgi:L-glyceraldehyde 3-phosphate reductase